MILCMLILHKQNELKKIKLQYQRTGIQWHQLNTDMKYVNQEPVALFFWVRAISASISLIFSIIPILLDFSFHRLQKQQKFSGLQAGLIINRVQAHNQHEK